MSHLHALSILAVISNVVIAMEGEKKTWRLLPSLKCSLSEQFQSVVAEEVSLSKKPLVPDNTWHATDWAGRTFEQWKDFCNSKHNHSKCPRDILTMEDKEALCHWLCIFVMEVRKESVDP